MAKENKTVEPTAKKFKERVKIETDFHETMKLLAKHANTKGTVKHTYKNRNNDKV